MVAKGDIRYDIFSTRPGEQAVCKTCGDNSRVTEDRNHHLQRNKLTKNPPQTFTKPPRKNNNADLLSPNPRRLARRGGVKRISGLIYDDVRGAIKDRLKLVRYSSIGTLLLRLGILIYELADTQRLYHFPRALEKEK